MPTASLSELQFRTLLESAPDAFVIADAQGEIVLVNAQTERLFGYGRHELIGMPVELLVPSRLWPDIPRGEGSPALLRHLGMSVELKGFRKDGKEFPIEVSLSLIPNAQGSWVVAEIRDITERKLVERQLVVAQQRSEEANRAKSEFLAAMSHEIRTPMNAILGMSDLLSETNLDEEQRQYVQVFRRAGSNLLALINDILDLSKIESGNLELEQTEFELAELVDQSVELVASKAQAKRISLVPHVSGDLETHFLGDPTRLRQVLLNLLGNAVKFTEAGEVSLTVRAARAGANDALEFIVSDTGIGIPEDKLETIFEEFKQADSSTTRKYGGTGLGLAISRRIVNRMGGRLSVTSQVGKGSSFRFVVSLQPLPQRPSQWMAHTGDLHGKRVLLIDDDATNRLILRETLASWGLKTSEFSSMAEALDQLRQMPPELCAYSLVIVDRRMPGMDGFEAAARIRALHENLPVIMLTSDHRSGDALRRQESLLSGYAVRPVSRADLLQLVCGALKGAAITPPASGPQQTGGLQDTPGKSLNILVAEDSSDNRLLIQQYLKGSRHEITFVENGRDAVEQFCSARFDAILMDLHMPVLDGLSATRSVRALEQKHGWSRVPILALSANASFKDICTSLDSGCDAHLSKPISKQRLLAAIGEFANRKREGAFGGAAKIDDGVAELAPEYLAARRSELSQLRNLFADNDCSRIRTIGHNLKGSGAAYGFPQLTKLGAAMQSAAEAGDAETIRCCIDELGEFLLTTGASG